MKEVLCLNVLNYEGRRTIFTEKQLKIKAPKRPELRETGIIERIKVAVQNPTFVYLDYEHAYRFVYYRREYKINDRIRYLKVVIEGRKSDLFVITAYRPDYVKERGKTKLIYGKDND